MRWGFITSIVSNVIKEWAGITEVVHNVSVLLVVSEVAVLQIWLSCTMTMYV